MAESRTWIYESPSWNQKGVTLEADDRLLWWESGQGMAGGGASHQALADFLRTGAPVERVPADVLAEVTEAVRARIAAAHGSG